MRRVSFSWITLLWYCVAGNMPCCFRSRYVTSLSNIRALLYFVAIRIVLPLLWCCALVPSHRLAFVLIRSNLRPVSCCQSQPNCMSIWLLIVSPLVIRTAGGGSTRQSRQSAAAYRLGERPRVARRRRNELNAVKGEGDWIRTGLWVLAGSLLYLVESCSVQQHCQDASWRSCGWLGGAWDQIVRGGGFKDERGHAHGSIAWRTTSAACDAWTPATQALDPPASALALPRQQTRNDENKQASALHCTVLRRPPEAHDARVSVGPTP